MTEQDIVIPTGTPKIHKLEPAQWTWFFERPDGTIFATHENEAWILMKKNSQYQKALKFIGASDGTKFTAAVKRSHDHYRTTLNIQEAQQIVRDGEKEEIEAARGNMKLPRDNTHVSLQ